MLSLRAQFAIVLKVRSSWCGEYVLRRNFAWSCLFVYVSYHFGVLSIWFVLNNVCNQLPAYKLLVFAYCVCVLRRWIHAALWTAKAQVMKLYHLRTNLLTECENCFLYLIKIEIFRNNKSRNNFHCFFYYWKSTFNGFVFWYVTERSR